MDCLSVCLSVYLYAGIYGLSVFLSIQKDRQSINTSIRCTCLFPLTRPPIVFGKHHCLLKIIWTVISWPLLAAQVVMHTWCADVQCTSTRGAASYPGSFPLTGARGRAWVQGYMWSSWSRRLGDHCYHLTLYWIEPLYSLYSIGL